MKPFDLPIFDGIKSISTIQGEVHLSDPWDMGYMVHLHLFCGFELNTALAMLFLIIIIIFGGGVAGGLCV